ncbi:MAG TPA: DUF4093 domain-containing protein [Firmicutes bacterium]|nr:DUF4093 domain-containing protein [Bacillota bacterium]
MKIDLPIAVEGKYDKIKLASIVDANIITTGGFGIFSSDEKKLLIRRIAEPRGIIILTDSDGAGLVIRNYFRSILPPDKLIHLYIPQISGREKRKRQPSKAGILGVEGIDAGMLRKILEPFAVGGDRDNDEASANTDILNADSTRREVTKADFYSDRLSGGESSASRRAALCRLLDLPDNMSSNALLAAVNMLCGYDGYRELVDRIG